MVVHLQYFSESLISTRFTVRQRILHESLISIKCYMLIFKTSSNVCVCNPALTGTTNKASWITCSTFQSIHYKIFITSNAIRHKRTIPIWEDELFFLPMLVLYFLHAQKLKICYFSKQQCTHEQIRWRPSIISTLFVTPTLLSRVWPLQYSNQPGEL